MRAIEHSDIYALSGRAVDGSQRRSWPIEVDAALMYHIFT